MDICERLNDADMTFDAVDEAIDLIRLLRGEVERLKAQLSQIDDWVWNDKDKGISAEIFWRVHSLINSDEAESGEKGE